VTVGTVEASLAVAEILILAVAGFSVYRRREASVAEACTFAALVPWMTLSLLYQALFIVRIASPAAVVETAITVAALGVIVLRRAALRRDLRAFRRFIAARPVPAGILLILLVFLILQALVQPAPTAEGEVLARILTVNPPRASLETGPLSLTALCAVPPPESMPWNAAIVGLRFAAEGRQTGINLPGFFAYLAVVFGTYALARRYAWPATAFAVSVMVASMPRLALLSVSPGLELLPAASTVFALLSLQRAVEAPNAGDLCGFLVGAAFSVSQVWMSRVGVMVLLPLGGILLFRRHGISIWLQIFRRHWILAGAALVAALVFSQLWWVVFSNPAGSLIALPDAVVYNADGIQGAAANLLRYMVQSLHVPPPIDAFCRWAFSFEPSRLIEGFYQRLMAPVLGDVGAAATFRIDPSFRLPTVWFGPLGGALVLPAVVFCVRRAPRRLKAIAVMLIGYFFLTALILAWTPQSVRQMTLFFACSGFCTAYFLPPWRFGPRSRALLIGFSLALLTYSCLAVLPDAFTALLPIRFP